MHELIDFCHQRVARIKNDDGGNRTSLSRSILTLTAATVSSVPGTRSSVFRTPPLRITMLLNPRSSNKCCQVWTCIGEPGAKSTSTGEWEINHEVGFETTIASCPPLPNAIAAKSTNSI